jgi:hypothetical protein
LVWEERLRGRRRLFGTEGDWEAIEAVLLHNRGWDIATAASQNGVCITQDTCHINIMILFQNFSMMKDKSNKNVMFLS